MTKSDPLRRHLDRYLESSEAHVSTEDAFANLPAAFRGRRPAGIEHSPWEILEHIRIAQHDILEFCHNPKYTELDWPQDYWPPHPAPPTAGAWDASLERYREDLAELRAIATDESNDLFARIPHGETQTYLRELLLVVDHTSYHVGQLVLIRQLLGAWPPK